MHLGAPGFNLFSGNIFTRDFDEAISVDFERVQTRSRGSTSLLLGKFIYTSRTEVTLASS